MQEHTRTGPRTGAHTRARRRACTRVLETGAGEQCWGPVRETSAGDQSGRPVRAERGTSSLLGNAHMHAHKSAHRWQAQTRKSENVLRLSVFLSSPQVSSSLKKWYVWIRFETCVGHFLEMFGKLIGRLFGSFGEVWGGYLGRSLGHVWKKTTYTSTMKSINHQAYKDSSCLEGSRSPQGS